MHIFFIFVIKSGYFCYFCAAQDNFPLCLYKMETYLHRYLLKEAEAYLDSLNDKDFWAMTHDHVEFHDGIIMIVDEQCKKRGIRNKSSFLAAFFRAIGKKYAEILQKNDVSGTAVPTGYGKKQ